MKQADLAARLAANHGITKAMANHIIDSIGDILQEDLVANGKTSCFGLGNLTVVARAERAGRNPHTGDPIKIPAKNRVKFSPSTAIKQVVNG